MPLIPPILAQSSTGNDSFTNGSHNVVAAYPSNVTQGSLLVASIAGLVPEGGSDTYTINSISDTLGSSWTQLFLAPNGLTTGTAPNRTFWSMAMWVAFAPSSGANTVTFHVSATGGFSKSQLQTIAEIKNVSTTLTGVVGTGSSSTNPLNSGTTTTTQNNQFAISQDWYADGAISLGSAPAGTGVSWFSITGAGSPARPMFGANVAASGTGIAISGTNANSAPCYLLLATFSAAAPTAVTQRNGFFEDYPQMTWMKNVAFLCRDYWDQGLSTPYVGQLYPAPNSGGAKSGQTYPY